MSRTYVRRNSEAIAATPQLASFCDAINHVLIVMLSGGDKSTQERDIERAKALAQEISDE
jgi:hypothetical protein